MVKEIMEAIADPLRLPDSEETPTGWLGGRVGHLVLASAQGANLKSPFTTHLAGYDQESPYGTLAAWMRFPAPSPSTVVAMGLRTPVDLGQMGDGSEVFTILCALQVSGVRSVLLSRWAVGGESTAMLLRELVQELPFSGLSGSFSRAKTILKNAALDPSAEPLLSRAESDLETLQGSQPLFWAGYLVSSPEEETSR